MLVWLLRGVLLLAVLAGASAYAVVAAADDPDPTYPAAAAGPARLTGPAVLLIGGGIACSATLASDIAALTAGHCLSAPDGTPRGPMRAYVTSRGYRPDTDTADAAYMCAVGRIRTPARHDGPDDWAVAEIVDCHGRDGRAAPRVGAVAGHHRPADFAATIGWPGPVSTSYFGYPGTRDGRTGVLQRLDTDFTHQPAMLRVFRPRLVGHITCADAAAVPGGGSGGGVIAHTATRTRLVAINNFLIAGTHACFRKVDATIVAAVARATRDWLPEHPTATPTQ